MITCSEDDESNKVDAIRIHMSDLVEIELTLKERELILKYGYPFGGEARKLRAMADDKGPCKLRISEYFLEQLIGNLSISVNEMHENSLGKPDPVIHDINELAEDLEVLLAASK